MTAFHECAACFEIEERVFVDTFTNTKLCLKCLGDIAPYLTNSPVTEDDNLGDFVKSGPVRAASR